jgi:putative effector of murein hydrolase LrgA (UPF0299 family)
MRTRALPSLASSRVAALLVSGLGLVGWGLSAQFGLPVAAMVTGLLLLWAGARAAKDLR